jgi:Tfp pilus assembly major pilin PilA
MTQGGGITKTEQGLSLVGFLFAAAMVAVMAVFAMKIAPSVMEHSAIKTAIAKAKEAGATPAEIRAAFDKQATSGYIDSVTGQDLEVEKTGNGYEVSVAYQKKIGLVGPASLVIDYVASTNGNGQARKRE